MIATSINTKKKVQLKPSDYVKQQLEKFPSHGSLTIAKACFHARPDLFKSVEQARSCIRNYRGSMGNYNRSTVVDTRFVGQKLNTFDIEPSDKDEYLPHIITSKKIGLLSDIHFPYHDKGALDCALEWMDEEDVDHIILNGDIVDTYQASSFVRDPLLRSLQDEIEMTKRFLVNLKKNFPNIKITFKMGNHEERLQHYLFTKAPEIAHFPELQLDALLGLKELGIDFVKDKRIIKVGGLAVIHGHEYRGGFAAPVNPARGFFLKAKSSVIGGHHHQVSEHSAKTINQTLITCWSTGCLCELTPHYLRLNDHGHGCAIIEVEGEKFYVKNRRILDGRML